MSSMTMTSIQKAALRNPCWKPVPVTSPRQIEEHRMGKRTLRVMLSVDAHGGMCHWHASAKLTPPSKSAKHTSLVKQYMRDVLQGVGASSEETVLQRQMLEPHLAFVIRMGITISSSLRGEFLALSKGEVSHLLRPLSAEERLTNSRFAPFPAEEEEDEPQTVGGG